MKMIRKTIFIALGLFILLNQESLGQKSQTSYSVQQIDSLVKRSFAEKEKELINKNTLNSANESLKASKQYAQNADQLMNRFFTSINVILGIIALLSTAGVGTLVWYLIRESKKQLDQRLEELSKGNLETIKTLIENTKDDNDIREACRVIVVSLLPITEISESFKLVLNQFGDRKDFKPKYLKIDSFNDLNKKLEEENYDTLIVYNSGSEDKENWEKPDNPLITSINELPDNIAIMCFDFPRIDLSELDDNKKTLFSSTNMEGQLFGNLMNLLRYKKIIDNIKN